MLHEVETGEPGFRNVVVCKGACLPWTGPAPAPTAQDINHHKLFLFDIGGVRSVAVTSSNFETRMHGQGNSMIRATAPALWRFHHAYFNRLKAQRWDGWVEPNLSVRSGKTQAWVYPRRRDPVVATLRSVRCDARFRTVDVLWAVIQRADVRRALQEVHRRGCRVRVVTTRDLIENWLEVPQRGADGAVLDLPDSRGRTYLIHDKVILIAHREVGQTGHHHWHQQRHVRRSLLQRRGDVAHRGSVGSAHHAPALRGDLQARLQHQADAGADPGPVPLNRSRRVVPAWRV